MRVVFLIGMLLAVPPDRPAPRPPEMPPNPQMLIYGDWQDGAHTGFIFRLTPTESIFLVNGKTSEGDGLTATYTIDWTTKPHTIVFMPRQRGGKMPGIFELDGDKLKLGLQTGGGPQPRDFGACNLVLNYKRVRN